MSDNIYEGPTMYVTRYVGPADEGDDRQRWQFTPLGGDMAVLTREELRNLTALLLADLAHTPAGVDGVTHPTATARLRRRIAKLEAERELGPQTQRCPSTQCSVQTVGSGYRECPKCGGTLQELTG